MLRRGTLRLPLSQAGTSCYIYHKPPLLQFPGPAPVVKEHLSPSQRQHCWELQLPVLVPTDLNLSFSSYGTFDK